MKSKAWHQRHKNDGFVKQAQKKGYRARSAFKLAEIDKRDKLFKLGMTVLDVGAAPGSWSQYASEQICKKGQGRVIAIDRLKIEPIENVDILIGDIKDEKSIEEIYKLTNNEKIPLVICDIAPDITGISDVDQARMVELLNLVIDFCLPIMSLKANMLLKIFEGNQSNEIRQRLQMYFSEVQARKPKASRDKSKEFYLLAKNFKLNID